MEKQIIRSGNTFFFYSKKEMNTFLHEQHLYAMKDHSLSDLTLGVICGIWAKVLDMHTVTIFSTKATMQLFLNQ